MNRLLLCFMVLFWFNSAIAIHVAASIFNVWRYRPPIVSSATLRFDSTNTTKFNGTIQSEDFTQMKTVEEHKRNRPERGKLLPDNPNAQDMYEAYKSIQTEYLEKAFSRANQWKVLRTAQDVTVSILHHETDPTCPYVKMEGIMPVPVQNCWNFLNIEKWDKNMPKMDPFYEGVSNHGEYNVSSPLEGHKDRMTRFHAATGMRKNKTIKADSSAKNNMVRMILCRKRMLRILTFGKRDLVFLSCSESEPLPDGSLVSGTVSVRTAMVPRMKGYTRAFQDSIAFYRPLQNNTKTALTIVCRIDLNDSGEDGQGGFIPMWLYVRTIGLTATQSVHNMRLALIEEDLDPGSSRPSQQRC